MCNRLAFKAWSGGCALVAAALTQSASAGLVSYTGVELIEAPETVRGGQNEANVARLFLESDMHLLSQDLMVDAVAGGALAFEDLDPTMVGEGSLLESWFIHIDPVDRTPISTTGSLTFDGQILGVIVTGELLFASDAALGNPGTLYPNHGRQARGLDLDSPDSFMISEDGRTLNFEILRTDAVYDQVRILVGPAVPTPGGMALLGAIAAFGSRRRR